MNHATQEGATSAALEAVWAEIRTNVQDLSDNAKEAWVLADKLRDAAPQTKPRRSQRVYPHFLSGYISFVTALDALLLDYRQTLLQGNEDGDGWGYPGEPDLGSDQA